MTIQEFKRRVSHNRVQNDIMHSTQYIPSKKGRELVASLHQLIRPLLIIFYLFIQKYHVKEVDFINVLINIEINLFL